MRLEMRQPVVMLALCCLGACVPTSDSFDLVVRSGRVIDPETNLDAVRDIGIRGDTIVRISVEPLTAARTIEARGLVVAPGFIDLHQHAQTPNGYRLMALDGVTTALELELGVPDIARFIEVRRGRTPIHFGATASHLAARVHAWELPLPPNPLGLGILPQSSLATNEPASAERLDRILSELRGQIDAGALGIGLGLEYSPGATRHEVIEIFRLAAKQNVPVFVHVRYGAHTEPGSNIEAVSEVIGAAAISGASLHIVHINSMCTTEWPQCVSMIKGARARGLDVTTEAYPYTVGMTSIGSALFNPGWREREGLDYRDLELPETGERLTRERFEVLHAAPESRDILVHLMSDEVADAVMADPLVAVASDGAEEHPRGAGTHAKVLARYVRDQKTITLSDAIRKMSLMPAQRLERTTAIAKRLGRLQEGAQADIVIFDPQTIHDRATFKAPTEASVGVQYLVVAGTIVVDRGYLVKDAAPGRSLVRFMNSEAAVHTRN
jgi:N-acyl-D-aspartate/D-glutamate deacylase